MSFSLYITANMLSIVEHVEGGIPYPDSQFLKRASGPILARDPFSSLMWILFCLPCPFLSCEESFLSLVHIFYVVSVAQVLYDIHFLLLSNLILNLLVIHPDSAVLFAGYNYILCQISVQV